MNEKKLTDEEIIKALKCCMRIDGCDKCPLVEIPTIEQCRNNKNKCALDLIKHLQGENKRLKQSNKNTLFVNEQVMSENAKQKAEIERLKDDKEEIRLFNLAIQNGEIDMRIESEMAKSFYNSIIQIFEQNGAKNFFTTTVDIDGQNGRYAFTIEKVGGQTVADKIAELKAEIERLKEEHKKDTMLLYASGLACEQVKAENAELQKQVDELEKENKRYAELFGMVDKPFYAVEVSEWEKVKNGVKEMIQQTVKDTAKEIYSEIGDDDILVISTQEYGKIEVVPLERLQEIIKSKGVEVE